MKPNLTVYKSSAGSGKTFTLSINYIAICLTNKSKDYFKKILAITFTNKAANEMKDRILSYLKNISEKSIDKYILDELKHKTGLDEEEIFKKASIIHSKMIHNYSDLSIMTIDKFNYQIVRSFSRDFGISNNFEIELDIEKIIEPAIKELLNKIDNEEDILAKNFMSFLSYKLKSKKSTDLVSEIENFSKQVLNEKSYISFPKKVDNEFFVELQNKIKVSVEENKKKLSQLNQKSSQYLWKNNIIIDHLVKRPEIFNFFDSMMLDEKTLFQKNNSRIENRVKSGQIFLIFWKKNI